MFERVMAFWTSVWKPGSLRAAAGGPPDGSDRRDLPRHPRSLEIVCRPMAGVGDLPRWPAVIEDVSAGGIGLLLSQPLDIGTLLALTWPRPIPGIAPTLTVRVLRVSPQPGGLWRLGCAFATDLNEPQLQALLDALR